jgi:hypothetical protein
MPSLYGISQSNRSGADLWGKNQFNSTFPASLCCYMRDKGYKPVYVHTDADFNTHAKDDVISFDEVFNTSVKNEKIKFLFESNFAPYTDYLHDALDHTDLVTNVDGIDRRALEIKLTVLPDNSTCRQNDEALWGSELVIRPDSISYACLGVYANLRDHVREIRNLLEPTTIRIESWENSRDILNNADEMLDTLTKFFQRFSDYQIPFLIQPIWKTRGKSPDLADNAFDVFVWSDFALLKLAIDQAKIETNRSGVSRYLRSVARTIRALSDLFITNKIHVSRIFRQMALGNQTDKEFALNGSVTRNYMSHVRLKNPKLKKEVLREIILNGGEKMLSPERRFDATIYFTASNIFDEKSE